MRKLFIALFALVLAGGIQAKPVEELTALAAYFPADTQVFAAIRADDGYAETLNGVLAQIDQNTGGDLLTDDMIIPSIKDLLGQFLFEDMSWVGETAAIGLVDVMQQTAVIAFEIGDPTGVELFIEDVFFGMADVTEGDGYTIYSNGSEQFLVTDEVVLTSNIDLVTLFEQESSLAASSDFTNAFDLLPNDRYNIALYINSSALNTSLMNNMTDMDEFNNLMPMFESGGNVAVGFTILNGRDLVIDVAVDEVILPLGLIPPAQNPINLDFAQHIPGNAQLVIHDNNLSGDVLYSFEAMNVLGPVLQELIETFAEMDNADTFGLDVSTINFGGLTKNAIIPIFAGLTGLNLEDDVLSWMTGDYALTLSLIQVPDPIGFTLDGAFIVEATEAEAAANVVSQLGRAAELYGLAGVSMDDDVVVLGDLLPSLLEAGGLPADILDESPSLDFLIASNDDVFAFGSRPAVTFALDPQAFTLADHPDFQHAASLFLPETQTVFYIGTDGLVEALPALNVLGLRPEEIQQVQFLLAQVESLTISGVQLDESSVVTRLTLSIPEQVDLPALTTGN
ncbi:MAG: DUF3352 domain-containing protein [Chloroflexi bacterium]|nr:MAG: DUF3352 domain-containing protein [Chloroflexota bacterium]